MKKAHDEGLGGQNTPRSVRERTPDPNPAPRENPEFYPLLIRAGHLAVWDWDLRTNTMAWDDEMLKLYGIERDQFAGGVEDWHRGLHPEDRARALADCQAALEGIRDFDTEFRVLQPQGGIRYVKANGLVLRDASGAPQRMLGLNLDLTHGRRAEENYQTLFREMLDGFALHEILCDEADRPIDYRFLAVNPAFESMTGLRSADIVGRTVREALPGTEQSWIDRYGKVALTGEPSRFENYSEALGKHFKVTAFRPAPRQFACIFVDITERVRAEEEKIQLQRQLQLAQKMESVGMLAGGIAHDFNNMLGVILGHTELALTRLDPAHPAREDLGEIARAVRRSAELTNRLLAFARKQRVTPRVLDLNQAIADALAMLRRLIGDHIVLDWRPCATAWPVYMDPGQIDQLMVNLCLNARDAIRGAGRITIETENCVLAPGPGEGGLAPLAGEYVRLAVHDDGAGMDPETVSHLFEPFFTTKEVGHGAGLGLAVVYGIVQQNHGGLHVDSAPGRGTTFTLHLPRHGKVDAG